MVGCTGLTGVLMEDVVFSHFSSFLLVLLLRREVEEGGKIYKLFKTLALHLSIQRMVEQHVRKGLGFRLFRKAWLYPYIWTLGSQSVYHPARQVLSLNNQRQEQLCQGQGIGSFRLSNQVLMNNSRDKMAKKFNGNRGFYVCSELTRGPRANRKEGSSSIVSTENSVGFLMRRDNYNLQDFQITYEKAKFFMIKSYSEDDIHKSIKYNVWSSTPNGNKKLDAAFREAEARAKETTKCPIFLFFSAISNPHRWDSEKANTGHPPPPPPLPSRPVGLQERKVMAAPFTCPFLIPTGMGHYPPWYMPLVGLQRGKELASSPHHLPIFDPHWCMTPVGLKRRLGWSTH
ncbi:hypothetical protein Taro_010698 [Colocasia esculenta]|uniref:YTH domain-containing family protein n=1 Tax=Colocasia esculenta TaxID=4460 RepID=A0A843U4B1_COLES|nr:hypothetical protein [Colocasia esculenta]